MFRYERFWRVWFVPLVVIGLLAWWFFA